MSHAQGERTLAVASCLFQIQQRLRREPLKRQISLMPVFCLILLMSVNVNQTTETYIYAALGSSQVRSHL